MSPGETFWSDLVDDRAQRFDDRAATVFAGLAGDAAARRIAWRQAIDLLSQPGAAGARAPALIDAVAALAPGIDPAVRAEAAQAAAFGAPPPALILLFAGDRPAIAAALLRSVRLTAAEWAALLPQLSTVARGILRARGDLDADTRARLAGFGPVDLVLPGAVESGSHVVEPGMTRIADLVARIEAYRHTRRPPAPANARAGRAPALTAFAFETDEAGLVRWTDAADERGALIGLSLSQLAEPGGAGVDGVAFGAVRRRCAFRDARLIVGGEGPAGGEWRISAAPAFDPASGRCTGYRGAAARPRADQTAAPARAAADAAGESIRQLVHELRTPLNAIGGFAELIAGQVMGPVAASYRIAATDIGVAAGRVLAAIEDLDIAARIDAAALPAPAAGEALFVHAVRSAITDQEPALASRGASLVLAGSDIDGSVAGDAQLVEQLVARFVAAFAPFAGAGETLMLVLSQGDGWRTLALDRPRGLVGVDRAAMLAGAAEAAASDVEPHLLLGLPFTIRLLAGLAHTLGGSLGLDGDRLTLSLPAGAIARSEDGGG